MNDEGDLDRAVGVMYFVGLAWSVLLLVAVWSMP